MCVQNRKGTMLNALNIWRKKKEENDDNNQQ